MLAEIAAANAAFAVIKEALNNGGELTAIGGKLGEYFGLKAEIQKKVKKDSSDFWELEKLKQQEDEFREMLIYQGRAGLWDDWLQFQAEQARARRDAEKEQKRKQQARKEKLYNVFVAIMIGITGVTGIGVIGLIIWVITKSR
jgi:hypothetical protein